MNGIRSTGPGDAGRRLGRREVGRVATALSLGFAASPACAQGTRAPQPTGVALPLPLPCAAAPGEITGFLLEGTGSRDGTVVVLGQAFRRGDLPRGAVLHARTADGRAVPAQIDVTVRHDDGSARFGVVSLAIPAAPQGQRIGIVLARRSAEAAAAPLDLIDGLAGRQALATITPADGGPPWTVDLLALLRATPSAERPWQSGPLAVQRRIVAAVPPTALGGITSMRLVADIALRADGTLWVDLWLRNDVAMRPGGGTAQYALRLVLDGQEVIRADRVRQFQYQAWGRLRGVSRGGAAAPLPPYLRPDSAYLAATGAVANYDQTIGVDETLLARLGRDASAAAWEVPLSPRGITTYMGTAGGRPDLGPLTGWQAAWLTSGDPRAARYALGQAEAAGAAPWHMWDARGGWMTVQQWPDFWFDSRNGPPPRSLSQPVVLGMDGGWHTFASHQPDLSFLPFLLTGRRAFLDGLQAQGAWNVLQLWPYLRRAPGPVNDMSLLQQQEIRGMAWSIRQVQEAGWISPDGDPMQAYLREVAARNWTWLRAQLPAWTERQGEAHGWIPPASVGPEGILAPWQQEHFASSAAAAARHGNADARAVLAWMANFLVGRFEAERHGFARNDGAASYIPIHPRGGSVSAPYRSWAEIGAEARRRDIANGTGWRHSNGDYGRLAMQTLALLQDVLGHAGARRAYQSLVTQNPPPFTDPAARALDPVNNITPRDLPLLPDRLQRCTRARS